MSTHIIPLDSLAEFAASLVSDNPLAPEYRCSYCGREEDGYTGAHDDAVAAMREFIEHTAFDHSDRADILRVDISVIGHVARQDELTPQPGPVHPAFPQPAQYRAWHRGTLEPCTRAWTHGDCPENHLYGPTAAEAI